MKKFGNVLWGIVLIIVGVIFGLNAVGLTDINVFFRGWWTLFIIVPSFIELFRSTNKMWSIIWLVIGIVLLLCAQNILSFRLIGKLIFPFILVMIGLSIIFKDTVNKKVTEKIRNLNSNKGEFDEFCATFGSQQSDFSGQEFQGANLDAVFGSVELDISKAIIKNDQVINANAIFGGIEIRVPTGVNIKVKSTPIFGGVSNKAKTDYNESSPTIYINGVAMFGGVEIK